MPRTNRLPVEALTPFLIELPEVPAPLDPSTYFGNDHPVEFEIGFGKGLFLVTTAQAHPEVNFLGVEIMRKYQLFVATRVAKRGLANVKLAKADARDMLRDHVKEGSVRAVHVYFPDPWWKKRHHKRRLFTAEFAQLCERVLSPSGRLHVATDVADYFTMVTELTAATQLTRLPPPDEKAPAHDLDYLTNFERKFRKQGLPVYRASWEKR